MKPLVTGHVHRLAMLTEAAPHVVALDYVSRRLGRQAGIIDAIESVDRFKITLATMHQVVVAERFALEARVPEVARNIICSTRVLVSTVGSLLRESALREVGNAAGVFSFVLCGEATHTQKFFFLTCSWLRSGASWTKTHAWVLSATHAR